MARSLTLHRRRPGIVDLTLPVRPNVASYNFFFATNFDGSFTQFDTVPASGKASPSVVITGSEASGFRGLTRFVFNPADYTASFPSMVEGIPLYIQIQAVSTAGVTGSTEAMMLVLPYSSAPNRPIMLSGTAPNEGSLASSLEIQLPFQCQNPNFQVNGSDGLFVAFEPTGAEWLVPPVATDFLDWSPVYPSVTQIFVRGNGGTTTFTAIFELRNNPLG